MKGPLSLADRSPGADWRGAHAQAPLVTRPNGPVSLEGVHGAVSLPRPSASFWRKWRAFVGPAILVGIGCAEPGNWGAAVAGTIDTKARDTSSTASSQLPDKSRYSLFEPTPDEFLREMSTDRPDKTESPFTVDAGHIQVELDLVSYTHDHDTTGGGDTRTDALAFAPLNVRVGLIDSLEFDLLLQTFNQVRLSDHATGTVQRMSGYGDTTLRLKYSFWGNGGGPSAFGVIPFVKVPSNQDHLGNHAVEGGIILPLALNLPHGCVVIVQPYLHDRLTFQESTKGDYQHIRAIPIRVQFFDFDVEDRRHCPASKMTRRGSLKFGQNVPSNVTFCLVWVTWIL